MLSTEQVSYQYIKCTSPGSVLIWFLFLWNVPIVKSLWIWWFVANYFTTIKYHRLINTNHLWGKISLVSSHYFFSDSKYLLFFKKNWIVLYWINYIQCESNRAFGEKRKANHRWTLIALTLVWAEQSTLILQLWS